MTMIALATGTEVDPPGKLSMSGLLRDVYALQRTLERYRGVAIDLDVSRAIASRVASYFDDDINYNFLVETLHQYRGRLVDDRFAQCLALQLVARRSELDRAPLTLYHKPVKSEWVALEMISVQEAVWRETIPGALLGLFALSGHPAGHTLSKKVPANWLNYLAYQVGFSKTRRYDCLPWTLIGMKLWGYLIPDVQADTLNFAAWFVSPGFLKSNREIIRYRTRYNPNTGAEKPECPHQHSMECDQCTEKETECPASIHRNWLI